MFITDVNTPAIPLLNDIMRKVNAFGHQPRIIVELDRMAYIPGIKSPYPVVDYVTNQVTQTYDVYDPTHLDASAEIPTISSNGMLMPVVGVSSYSSANISDGYDPTGAKLGRIHKGIDFAYPEGSTVQAVLDGRVVEAGGGCSVGDHSCNGGCGNYVKIDHGNGLLTRYLHFKENPIVSQGDMVKKGQPIGHVGNTGDSYGAHCHFEVWKNGDRVDPVPYLKGTTAAQSTVTGTSTFPYGGTNNGDINTIMGMYGGTIDKVSKMFSIDSRLIAAMIMQESSGRKDVVSADGGYGLMQLTSSNLVKQANDMGGWDDPYNNIYTGVQYLAKLRHDNGGDLAKAIGSYNGDSSGKYLSDVFKHMSKNDATDILGNGGGVSPDAPTYTIMTKTVVNQESATYYRDWSTPFNDTTDGSTYTNIQGAESFNVADGSGGLKKIYGFNSLTGGTYKGFDFPWEWNRDGYLSFGYFANMSSDGDIVKIYMDDKPILALYGNGSGQKGWVVPPQIKVPKGKHKFSFHMYNANDSKSIFGLTFLKAAEFTDGKNTVQKFDVPYSFSQISEKDSTAWYDVGTFVYQETLILEDDIMSWEIINHFDQASATAQITIDNSTGLYSPDRDTHKFLQDYKESPWSYYEYGRVRGVISEGTPVRIYVGYGDQFVRKFTGYIKGEIEQDADAKTLTFHCVDRFDMMQECTLYSPLSFPDEKTISPESGQLYAWLKSSIVQYLAVYAGMTRWRTVFDDLMYPDIIVTDTYYMDLVAKNQTVMKFDSKGNVVAVPLNSIKTVDNYKNPFVEMIEFKVGEKVSDCIQTVIGDINYRAWCDRYGTFRLDEIDYRFNNRKWDFTEDTNILQLTTSLDYSKVRNHLMVAGARAVYEHFFDKDLIVATKGQIRTAGLEIDWIDETIGNERATKQVVADRLFFDMKRQARTKNVVIKGNPLIEVLDGCYVYDEATATAGYYIIKGDRLVGNQNGIVNFLEVTWEEEIA